MSIKEENQSPESQLSNYLTLALIAIPTLILIYYIISKKSKSAVRDILMICGPTLSGKTTFFYYLTNNKILDSVSSMEINQNSKLRLSDRTYKALDIPGIGYYNNKILESLANSKIVLVFLDSADKKSISESAEYLYNIINSEQFDEEMPLIVVCNKQDLKFSKNLKIIESELVSEIESRKQIKQKNNLDDQSQLGKLFFSMFRNVHIVESSKTEGFESVVNKIKQLLGNN